MENTDEVSSTNERAALFAALAQAQCEFAQPVKNCKMNYGKYADLQECLKAVRPALNAHGLFLAQPICAVEGHPELLRITTRIFHRCGAWVELGEIEVKVEGNNRMNSAQAAGSAITYGRRYSLCASLGICADDDDDGNASGPNSAQENYRKPMPKAAPAPKTSVDPNKWWVGKSDMEIIEAVGKLIESASTMESLNNLVPMMKQLPSEPLKSIRATWAAKRECLK